MPSKTTKSNLTLKQEAFAQAYVKYGDASKAYREVYSCAKAKDKTIWEHSSRLLKNNKVEARVIELQAIAKQIADKKFSINAETILRHLDILRNARIDEYVDFVYEKVETQKVDDNGEVIFVEVPRMIFKPFSELTKEQLMCIESVKQNRYGEVELKLHGKDWTIEKINKHIGFYEKDNEQRKNPALIIEDELATKERIKALLEKRPTDKK